MNTAHLLQQDPIVITPVAFVKSSRLAPEDDHWLQEYHEIELAPHIPTAALDGIESFSHLEILYFFKCAARDKTVFSGRPRGNPDFPETGIFAQRKKDRPNHIGLTTVELVAHTGRTIRVKYFDAIDGTPVLDIKPVFRQFQPVGAVRQPAWVDDLMKAYW